MQGQCTYTPASVCLSNTTAKRRCIAEMLLGQFREVAELNDVDTIGRDFDTSANRERGKSNQSSIEEAWGTTFLVLPPDSNHCDKLAGCQAWKSSAKQSELHAGRAAKEMRGVEKNVRRKDKNVSPGIFQIRRLLRRRPPRWSRVEVFWTFRGRWQGNSGWKQSWSGAWKGWDDSSDERILHTMQDHLQQTTVITKRRPQKMLSKQSTSKTKDDAASEAMEALTQERERQEEARCVCEQKCDEASVAQTMFNDTFKVTLEKAEALERHVKTVTMRAESLATTDGDFFYTLVNRQEEGHKYLNSLSAQLSTVAPAAHHQKLKVAMFFKSSSSEKVLEEPLLPYMCVPEIRQCADRATSAGEQALCFLYTQGLHAPKLFSRLT